jgi:ABC-2 type transport system ATP-binding protein
MQAIHAEHITHAFGKRTVLEDLSFRVAMGEFFGILGMNGAGKTTLLRILGGSLVPTEGTVTLFERGDGDVPLDIRRSVGIVPEVSRLTGSRTAWEHLIASGTFHYVASADMERRAEELLHLLGLFPRRHEKVGTFSKGMKRRLAIAKELVHYPLILFLDEPTSGLDFESVMVIRNVLRDLNARGVTIVMTTHNTEEADRLCTRVAILHNGKCAALDSPEQLKQSLVQERIIEMAAIRIPAAFVQELSGLPGVEIMESRAEKCILLVRDPGQVMMRILECIVRYPVILTMFLVRGATMEDVLIHHTGLLQKPGPAPLVHWIQREKP